LQRRASRQVEMNCLTNWTSKTGAFHIIFSMGRRQGSRYGSATAPKVQIGEVYGVDRPDGERVFVRLYRSTRGREGVRFFFRRVVERPDDWEVDRTCLHSRGWVSESDPALVLFPDVGGDRSVTHRSASPPTELALYASSDASRTLRRVAGCSNALVSVGERAKKVAKSVAPRDRFTALVGQLPMQ
jgi:hypothetical protein